MRIDQLVAAVAEWLAWVLCIAWMRLALRVG
jgi:hypothetical protein